MSIVGFERDSDADEKCREQRARRACAGYGYRLCKSRTRNPDRPDFGLYPVVDPKCGGTVNAALSNHWVCSWTLDDVEHFLRSDDEGAEE